MSRQFEYTKKVIGSLQGSPAGECRVELDVSELKSPQDLVTIFDSFSIGGETVSCQVVCKELTGTLNGVVKLVQSNDGENYDDIDNNSLTLDSSNKTGFLDKKHFSGKYLGASIAVGGLTSGKIVLIFIIKHH